MSIYKDWDTFCLNADAVSEYLDEETLIRFAAALHRSREERAQLAVRVQAGDVDALREFVNSYVPIIVNGMRQRKDISLYSTELLFRCYDKIQKYVSGHLFLENLEYDTLHYVPWMVMDECGRYIIRQRRKQEKEKECLERKALLDEEYKEYMDSLPDKEFLSLEDGEIPSSVQELVVYMKERLSEREMKVILVRYGMLDGKTKTLEETADYFGVRRERIRQIESKALRKLYAGRYKKRRLPKDFLDD